MPLKTDRSDLPRQTTEGTEPDASPRFVTALAEAWHRTWLLDEDRPTATGSLLRGSEAASCAKAMSYNIRQRNGEGIAPSNPPTIADAYRFGVGTAIHDMFQAVVVDAFPGAEVEVVGVYDQPDLSLHADVMLTHNDKRVLIELKSVNGFGFRSMTTGSRGPAEGPRISAITQGALAAKALGADELVIALLSLELLSPDVAKRNNVGEVGRFCAEYTYLPDEFLPIADAELARMDEILRRTLAGEDVPRSIPGVTPKGARVVDPEQGRWELRSPEGDMILDSGSAWPCRGYCKWAGLCAADLKAGH